MKRHLLISVILITAALFLLSSGLEAKKSVEIKDLRFSSAGSKTRIVIEFNRLPLFKASRLANPSRLYFDLREAKANKSLKSIIPERGNVKKIRVAQFDRDTVRVVLYLNKAREYKVFTLNSPPRLVVDIGRDNKNDEKNPFYRKKKIVVLDPGHGGDDHGAVGPSGLKEKDVTLDLSRRLKRILEERYNLKVYLTRNGDKSMKLRQRTRVANRKSADLFVSIHVNASKRRKAGGLETYFLNWTNDAQALRVAARENAISVKKMRREQGNLGSILASLHRETKRDESLKLAHFIQDSLIKKTSLRYRNIEDRGVKKALFYVLVDAGMPSVLLEICFISNPREERLLRSRKFKRNTAEAVAAGIYRYILTMPDAPRLAMKGLNLQEL